MMAYNYYPMGYQPYQNYQPQQNNQSNGIVRVQSENEAKLYPVAPGVSLIFIDENAPYVYTKTVDISQLDRPKFEKFRLIREEPSGAPSVALDSDKYVTKDELHAFKESLEKRFESLKEVKNEPAV